MSNWSRWATAVMTAGFAASRPDRAYRTIVPCNLYGPGDDYAGDGAHLVASAIAKVAAAVAARSPSVAVWGDGTARREFMHVDDLCAAVVFLLGRLEHLPETVNVGTGVDRTVTEYYAAVAEAFGFRGGFAYEPERPQGMRRKLLDVSVLAGLGWTSTIPLAAGIADTVRWYRANHGTTLGRAA